MEWIQTLGPGPLGLAIGLDASKVRGLLPGTQGGKKWRVAPSTSANKWKYRSPLNFFSSRNLHQKQTANGKVYLLVSNTGVLLIVVSQVNILFESLRRPDENPNDSRPSEGPGDIDKSYAKKRTRTVSPTTAKRDLEAKRMEREKQKRDKRERLLNEWREERMKNFIEENFVEVPTTGLSFRYPFSGLLTKIHVRSKHTK